MGLECGPRSELEMWTFNHYTEKINWSHGLDELTRRISEDARRKTWLWRVLRPRKMVRRNRRGGQRNKYIEWLGELSFREAQREGNFQKGGTGRAICFGRLKRLRNEERPLREAGGEPGSLPKNNLSTRNRGEAKLQALRRVLKAPQMRKAGIKHLIYKTSRIKRRVKSGLYVWKGRTKVVWADNPLTLNITFSYFREPNKRWQRTSHNNSLFKCHYLFVQNFLP